jgi:hypothetical protein
MDYRSKYATRICHTPTLTAMMMAQMRKVYEENQLRSDVVRVADAGWGD